MKASPAAAAPQVLKALASSIARVGQLAPVIRGGDGAVVDGKLRLEACHLAGHQPWIVERPDLDARAHVETYVRRAMSPIELAELAQRLRDASRAGARRAPGTGRQQHATARAIEEEYGISVSAREVAYALQVASATTDEMAFLTANEPSSMRQAIGLLADHRAGATAAIELGRSMRTEIFKTASEFKAALLRVEPGELQAADVDMLTYLRDQIDAVLRARGRT